MGSNFASRVSVKLEETAPGMGHQWIPTTATYNSAPDGSYIDVQASPRMGDGTECIGHVRGNLTITVTNLDANGAPTSSSNPKAIDVDYLGQTPSAPFVVEKPLIWGLFGPARLEVTCLTDASNADYERSFHDCWCVYSISKIGCIELEYTYRSRWRMIRCKMPLEKPKPKEKPDPKRIIVVYLDPTNPLPCHLQVVFFFYRVYILLANRVRRLLRKDSWPIRIGHGPGPVTGVCTVTSNGRTAGGGFYDTETMVIPGKLQ